MNSTLVLKPNREKSVQRGHPWVFSGAIAEMHGAPEAGETVDIKAANGNWLAKAAYSPHSQIRARVWTLDPDERVDVDFFRERIHAALDMRRIFNLAGGTNAYRLVHAESDDIPGLIVDRYQDTLVVQLLTAGTERWRDALADLLLEQTGAKEIYERSDVDVRALEGLAVRTGTLRGAPPERILITENGLIFSVDIRGGHKTGFYLDQRNNRAQAGVLARERDVLDCFCYTGGFSLHALAGGARSVLAVDASAEALALARENLALNKLPAQHVNWVQGDVFEVLRKLRDENRFFDMVILDPPKFAPTSAQVDQAARGYKDINLLAFKLLKPGGILMTFSCSGGVDADLFQKIVAGAALDAATDAQIIQHLSQAGDHPVSLHFPEGAYLKGLVCRKTPI